MVKFYNGIPISIINRIVLDNREEKYHVSYNPSVRDYRVATTALVITTKDNKKELFYILSGNHSKQYSNCKSLKECIDYFIENKELMHKFSDALQEIL